MKKKRRKNKSSFLAFIDVETTGLNPSRGDRICEIAIIKQEGKKEVAVFESLVDPECPISAGAYAVNGITGEMLKDAPRFKDIALQIQELLSDSTIVAHNVHFDLGFINREFFILTLPPLQNPVIDTLSLVRKLYSFPQNNLATAANYLGIKTKNTHRAMADVQILRQLFFHIFQESKDFNFPNALTHFFPDLIG